MLFYLLSSSSSSCPSSSSSSNDQGKARTPPSASDLRKEGFMRMILDEDEVREAFERFQSCPLANVACELQGGSEEQARQRAHMDAVMMMMMMQTDDGNGGRALSACAKDARRAVVSVDCTMATYAERFSDEATRWMGQMMLEGVVNIPYERCFVPMEASDLQTLLSCSMLNLRIFNIHVQHCSRLLLKRTSSGTSHRFSENNLCVPVSQYESMGWVGRFFRK